MKLNAAMTVNTLRRRYQVLFTICADLGNGP